MNKEDIANIKIILYGTPEDFQNLYLQRESSDPGYIDTLLQKLNMKIEELVIEKQLEKMDTFPDVENLIKKLKDTK